MRPGLIKLRKGFGADMYIGGDISGVMLCYHTAAGHITRWAYKRRGRECS